jgi:hypothetical protein
MIMPRSPRLCQNCGLSVLSSIREIGESRVGGEQKSCFWSKKVCQTMHCREETASSFVAKARGEVFTYFHVATIKCHGSMRN